MKEDHRTEWKERWKDEFLRILCGFANSGGGRLVVGRNNNGLPVGVRDGARLLVDLPNKARDVQRVFEACRQAGAPAPEVECEGGEVRFEFSFAPDYLNALAASPETSGKTREKTRGKTREKILGLLATEPDISMSSLAAQLGISAKGVEWQMRRLRATGAIRRVGPAKGGRWEVIKR